MRKFAVISGFLGSGKTTTMMALTKESTDTAMISNDLGGAGLADHRLAQLSRCNAEEITDECICFQTEVLVERLNRLFDVGAELVMSDIPGFGVGALEHVYHTLSTHFPGKFELAPFTVLVEPETVRRLREEPEADVCCILRNQLLEADLLVLNKCDTLTAAEREETAAWLRQQNPAAELLTVSALTGEGLPALRRALGEGTASLRHPEIDYEDRQFNRAFDGLSEYYIQYYARVCCHDFDGSRYLEDLAETVRRGLREVGGDVPHLKLLAWEPEGDYGKADLIGVDRPLEFTRRFARPCVEVAVTLNASTLCSPENTDGVITGAVESVGRAYQLEQMIYQKQCMWMGGE